MAKTFMSKLGTAISIPPDHISLESYIRSLNKVEDMHEPEVKDHSRRTREVTLELARQLGFKGSRLQMLLYGADVHDIGKVGVSGFIIYKPGKLTKSEEAAMHTHSVIGYDIVAEARVPTIIKDVVLYHHEHWDGSGYPMHLMGEQIPIHTRIVTIADVWDALTSKRHYRPAYSSEKAFEIMNRNISWFDPHIYALWMKMIWEKEHG
jgi:putative nucleotidyltransferase with HDIG domain